MSLRTLLCAAALVGAATAAPAAAAAPDLPTRDEVARCLALWAVRPAEAHQFVTADGLDVTVHGERIVAYPVYEADKAADLAACLLAA